MEQNKPIRVAQIMGKLWAGGVEMVVFNYYRALDKNKIQFDFYYDADSTVEPPQDLIDMGARFIEIPPYQNLPQYLKTLKRHFKENDYRIVHSHINTLSVFPLFSAWSSHIPIRIAHNHSVPGGNEFKRNALKYFLRSFSKLFATDYFACSEKAGRWMFGNKAFDEGKVFVTKNAIDFNRFRPSENVLFLLRRKLGLEGKLVIGHIGRFTFAKNHKFLIETFQELSDKRSDAVLLLVGDGELNKQIHDLVNEYGVTDKTVFVGQVPDPENYYRLADVLVVPSVFEGLSLTTIESQIAGVPVVVSTAIPEEAIISNGCIRISLEDNCWINTIISCVGKKVILDSRSDEYSINNAVKKMELQYDKLLKN